MSRRLHQSPWTHRVGRPPGGSTIARVFLIGATYATLLAVWAGSASGDTSYDGSDAERLVRSALAGKKLAHGWSVRTVAQPHRTAISVELSGPEKSRSLSVRITRRDSAHPAFCRTPSFNIVYLTPGSKTRRTSREIHQVMDSVCVSVRSKDRGQVDLGPFVRPEQSKATGRLTRSPSPFEIPVVWVTASLSFLFLLAAFGFRRGRELLEAAGSFVEAHPIPLVSLVCLAGAALRLYRLDIPFDADYMTQRIFFASLDIGDILTHQYHDQRHPQLFYLLLHPVVRSSSEEWAARLPSVLLSIGCLPALFVLVRRRRTGTQALLACVLLSVSTPFLVHSRDVSDLTLFIFLALLSSHALLLTIEAPTRKRAAFFAITEAAMFYAYYLAGLVAICHLAVALMHARSRRHRVLWAGGAVAFVGVVPNLWELAQTLLQDTQARRVASRFPQHVWGAKLPTELLGRLMDLLLPLPDSDPSVLNASILGGALAATGLLVWAAQKPRDPLLHLTSLILVVSLPAVASSVALLRLNAYYLLFLLPFVAVSMAAGAMPASTTTTTTAPRIDPKTRALAAIGPALGGALAVLVVGSYASSLAGSAPSLYSSYGKDHFQEIGAVIRNHPPHADSRTVAADPDCLHTILLYYAFETPLEMYRTCKTPSRPDGGPIGCRLGGDRLVTLTAMAQMRPGWRPKSVHRLKSLRSESAPRPIWFVYTERFPNRPLLDYLKRHCKRRRQAGPLTLHLCPAPRAERRPRTQ